MKVPKARQLESGSWFVRVMIDGHSVSITRPTKKAAEMEAMALKSKAKKAAVSTALPLTEAIDRYIESRESVCSPSTLRGYRAIQAERFKAMMHTDVWTVTQEQWQRAIGAETKIVSAKTIKNAWELVSAVISEATGRKIEVMLPQVIRKNIPFLTAEEIPVFVKAIRGTDVEIAALLGLSSLRLSEILAIRWKDIDLKKKTISIRGAVVMNEKGERVRKEENKNCNSRRTISMIPPLAEALASAEQIGESVVRMNPATIRNRIRKVCKDNDLTIIGIHGLRHSFASLCYSLQVPELVVQQLGGWENSSTVHRIYTHISQKDIAERSSQIADFYASNL